MANYTSIEQSKKLIELGLDPMTADMIFDGVGYELGTPKVKPCGYVESPNTLPCWSVGGLLSFFPKGEHLGCSLILDDCYFVFDDCIKGIHIDFEGSTLFDAVFKAFVYLLENDYINKGE